MTIATNTPNYLTGVGVDIFGVHGRFRLSYGFSSEYWKFTPRNLAISQTQPANAIDYSLPWTQIAEQLVADIDAQIKNLGNALLTRPIRKELTKTLRRKETSRKLIRLPSEFIDDLIKFGRVCEDSGIYVSISDCILKDNAPAIEFLVAQRPNTELFTFVLQKKGTEYLELAQPLIARAKNTLERLIYWGASYDRRPIAASKKQVWQLVSENKVLHGRLGVLRFDKRMKQPLQHVPNGTLLGTSTVFQTVNIVHQDRVYHFDPRTRFEDGWFYSSCLYAENAIRFRLRADGSYVTQQFPEYACRNVDEDRMHYHAGDTYDVEAFPPQSNRFPLYAPVYLKDYRGRIWETLATNEEADLFIVKHQLPRLIKDSKKEGAEYGAFKLEGEKLRSVKLQTAARRILKLRKFLAPALTWMLFKRPQKTEITLPQKFNWVSVDIADLTARDSIDDKRPRVIRRFKEYAVDYGGHIIKIQIGKTYAEGNIIHELLRLDEIEYVHNILCTMPMVLLHQVRRITIIDENKVIGGGPDIRGTYKKGGHVVLISPKFIGGVQKKFGSIIIYHEFGHYFGIDTSTTYQRRLEAAVTFATDKDGTAGHRDYAERSWREALAVGFESFEHAGPTMQQLILNLLINPDWEPK